MSTPGDAKKPPAPTGEVGLPAVARYTGPDPKVHCGLLHLPGPSDEVLDVVAHVTAHAPAVAVGADSFPVLRGPLRSRLDLALPDGAKPLPVGGAQVFDLELSLARFQDRAYAVARIGTGVDLEGSTESTATGLQKVAWKLPRPC